MSEETARRPDGEYAVAQASDIPAGTHQIVRVRGVEIGLFNVHGQFHALPNICPHQYGPVCRGPVGGTLICTAETGWRHQWGRDGEILTCPWHGIEFDITTGASLAVPGYRLKPYPVRVVDGEVRIALRRSHN